MSRTFRNEQELIDFLTDYRAFAPGVCYYDENMVVHYMAALLQNMAHNTWSTDILGHYVEVLSPEAKKMILLWADAVRGRGDEQQEVNIQ